jgi:hypothetical protein
MDYKQSTVTGESWQRCLHIEINNPSGATPSIRFDEERRIALADGTSIGTPAGSINKDFTDPSATFPLLDPSTGNPVGATLSTARCMPCCGVCTWRWRRNGMRPLSRSPRLVISVIGSGRTDDNLRLPHSNLRRCQLRL